jgi:virginiamycin B lyase
MRTKTLLPGMAAGFALILALVGANSRSLAQEDPAALAGQVRSAAEGLMEGVVVSAQKAASTVTVSVISDVQGQYSFPRNRLSPGRYALSIRAVGYEMDDPGAVEVTANKTVTANVTLRTAKDLSSQLTNAEWLSSMPGTDDQKAPLLTCTVCHTLERIVKSKHDAAEFVKVLERMGTYTNSSFPLHVQKRPQRWLLQPRGEALQQSRQRFAQYLSTINLSSSSTWSYPLTTFPRPKGKETQVIITEYDLPRAVIEPHDVIVDAQGMAWYSNFGENNIGRLDPRTAKVTEYPVPTMKEGFPTGNLGIQFDESGAIWLAAMNQGGIAKFDPKTETFRTWTLPPEWNNAATQINMVHPERASVDGKVWLENHGYTMILRMDLASGTFEPIHPFEGAYEKGEVHNIYDVVPDSKNNAYFTDFEQGQIGRVDAKTGHITFYQTPTPKSKPRRAWMDADDRFWIAEYGVNRVAVFDTRTERFQEWLAPTPWSAPYDVVVDKNGDVWAGSVTNDRVLRLDPRSGQSTEYLLPRSTNIRRVFVDNSTNPVTFWVGSNHGASIVKVEPVRVP